MGGDGQTGVKGGERATGGVGRGRGVEKKGQVGRSVRPRSESLNRVD